MADILSLLDLLSSLFKPDDASVLEDFPMFARTDAIVSEQQKRSVWYSIIPLIK